MSPSSSSRQHSKENTMQSQKMHFCSGWSPKCHLGAGIPNLGSSPKVVCFLCFLLYCPPITWYCLHTPHPYPCPSLLLTWKPKEVDQQLRQSKSLPSYQHTRTSIMLMMKILPKIPEIMLCLISKIFQLFRKKTFDLDMNWRHCISLWWHNHIQLKGHPTEHLHWIWLKSTIQILAHNPVIYVTSDWQETSRRGK